MPTPTGYENLQGALSLAMSICFDETHGYTTTENGVPTGRQLNPDVDCSALVCHCLYTNGFNVTQWGDTASMITELSSYSGFQHYIYDPSMILQHGDILVWDGEGFKGHTFFYAENVNGFSSADSNVISLLPRARIEASSSRTGQGNPHQAGDQRKNGTGAPWEVWVHAYSQPTIPPDPDDPSIPWHLFRWSNAPPPPPTGNIPKWLLAHIQKRRKDSDNGYEYY